MINKKILGLALLSFFLAILIVPVSVFANPPAAAAPSSSTKLTDMMTSLSDAAIQIGTSVVVIGWIIAGILYLTAAGKPEKIQTAKNAMIACVVGTVLVILAQAASTISSVIGSAFNLPSLK